MKVGEPVYIAHINEENQIQSVKQHCENTAILSRSYSISQLKDIAYITGLLHDIGKYQMSFQDRINHKSTAIIDHSICGAIEVSKIYSDVCSLIMEYCIAGHHTGIPDGGNKLDSADMPTLYGRMKKTTENYSCYKEEFVIPKCDSDQFQNWLLLDCTNKEDLIEKFAFATRYLFSCITDADSNDTSEFCSHISNEELKSNFAECLDKINKCLKKFKCITQLQKARSAIQQQVYDKAHIDSEIYLMNMPTGSGKTLCSMKFALERAIKLKKRRIIYIIPYNSIIDQTAEEFEKLFGDSANILRHQSSFSYDDYVDEDYRKIIIKSAENWNSQIIITTTVQFFESVYANKRGKLRKLHNMADSILIFDESHLMPAEYLAPCLRCISYITKYLNSEAVFLSATMPNFCDLIQQFSLKNSNITNLIENTSEFDRFNKCSFVNLGTISDSKLIESTFENPTSLIIVNKRKTALKLYNMLSGNVYHLSTYMTSDHRKKVIDKIKSELTQLEIDYPNLKNVPQNRRITVISTSLIEAGVDLDFYCVYRELTGLDSILQAGGRCNREGKRNNAKTYIFSLEQQTLSNNIKEEFTKGLIDKYSDISCTESISEYYMNYYNFIKDTIKSKAISSQCHSLDTIPFSSYADEFNLIDNSSISLVVQQDDDCKALCKLIEMGQPVSHRKLQKYTCTVYPYELEDLKKQGAVNDYGSGIWILTNDDYYDKNTGVIFEASDYFI